MADNLYKSIIDHYPVAYARHRVIYDDLGFVKDYEFIELTSSPPIA